MHKYISKLHYITQHVEGSAHAALAEEACRGGVDWVQLRVKGSGHEAWLSIAREVKVVCEKYNAKLIINDNVQVAKEIEAYGVHLGKEDTSPIEARKILGNDFIIGGTANTLEDVRRLEECGVDYIGLGPYRFTETKEKLSPILGLEGIVAIAAATKLPVIAIGGIKQEDVRMLMEHGVHGIAVSSAINLAANRADAAAKFCAAVRQEVMNE